MPTSELSDALNPYASQARRASPFNEYPSQNSVYSYPPVAQHSPLNQSTQPQGHIQHVSELQNAVVQAVPPPPPPVAVRPRQGPPQMFTELVRIITATRTAQEVESKRRLAWEQEQEAKAAQNKEDMEKKMLNLYTEITTLRSKLDTLTNPPPPANTFNHSTPQFPSSITFVQNMNGNNQMASPISPASQPSSSQQPMFIQGSSTGSLSSTHTGHHISTDTVYSGTQPNISYSQFQVEISQPASTQPTLQSITPDPSPHLTFVETSRSPSSSSKPSKRQRRKSQSQSSDDGNANSSSSSSAASRPRKRRSHHDTRCYTISHAMRLHMLRMMVIETDKELPGSHTEGTSLSPSDPVRFVWDKTTKQSVHNARMKTRVLEDIKENQRLYKHVNRKEFGKKALDTVFEQCFTTFRSKFKSQQDNLIAEHLKKREDGKARKARHLSRRKTKLSNRSEARNKIPTFEHVTFDGALQVDCMSSEESDYEGDHHSPQTSVVLKTRGYAWRSTRLLRFFGILDDEEKSESVSRPKRGLGKKERQVGPNKEEFILPPKGVATWMISRRWYKASLATRTDLPQALEKLIDDPDGFNWTHFHDLGDESVDEDEVNARLQQQQQQQQQQQEFHFTMQQQQWQPPMPLQPNHPQVYNPHIHNMNLAMTQHIYDPNSYNLDFNL